MNWKFAMKFALAKRTPKRLRRMGTRPKLEELEVRQLLSLTSALFTVDPNNSIISLSGDVGGSTILPQGPGALTTNYSGSVAAQWDLDNQTIQFLPSGTALNATNTGNWQPMPGGASGSAPADYGGQISIVIFTANIAIRNLVVSGFSAGSVSLMGTGPYNFVSSQMLMVATGTADYNAGFLGSGNTDLSGLLSNNQSPVMGTFEDLGNGSFSLTEPISFTVQKTVGGLLATLHVEGQVVSNAVLPVINLTDGSGSSFDYATSAVGGAGPVAVEDPAAAVTRTPDANLTSMTVTLTNRPDDVAEFLGYSADLVNSYGLSTNGYDPTSGQLVITGSADPSVYQAILHTITYENDSLTPDTSDRRIQFVVSDGTNNSAVRTTTVSVSAPMIPAPPGGPAVPKQPLALTGSAATPDTLSHAVFFTQPQLNLGSPSRDLQTTALDLATTRLLLPTSPGEGTENGASDLSARAIRVAGDLLVPVEAWATDRDLLSA